MIMSPFFYVPSLGFSYTQFLSLHHRNKFTVPSMHEKIAFYLFWVCKFLLDVPGFKITRKYLPLAVCLAQGKIMALAPLFLRLFTNDYIYFMNKKITSNCGCQVSSTALGLCHLSTFNISLDSVRLGRKQCPLICLN